MSKVKKICFAVSIICIFVFSILAVIIHFSAKTSLYPVVYLNNDFCIKVELPIDWKNYAVFYKKAWIGDPTGILDEKQIDLGNQIVIRSPKWTKSKPTQDILINIFNIREWTHSTPDVSLDVFRYNNNQGPVADTEIARNSEYVFSIPSRFDIYELDGVKEVQKIVFGNNRNITAFSIN